MKGVNNVHSKGDYKMKSAKLIGYANGSDGYVTAALFDGVNGEGDVFFVDDIGVQVVSGVSCILEDTEEFTGTDEAINDFRDSCAELLSAVPDAVVCFLAKTSYGLTCLAVVTDDGEISFYNTPEYTPITDMSMEGNFMPDLMDDDDPEISEYIAAASQY